MPFYYEDLAEGYPSSDLWSEKSNFGSEPRSATLPSSGESMWTQPEFVSPLEVELNPRYSPSRESSTTLSPLLAFQQSHSTNGSQALLHTSSQDQPRSAEQDKKKPSPKPQTRVTKKGSRTRKEKIQNDKCTLDEFWYEDGKDWSKVQASMEERKIFKQSRYGVENCATAPECFTCGTKLSLEEIMNPGVACRVCACFN
ncbi:hypothetical protein F4781DRAFT_167808 [Annulohypoxylon bovei var. microspora]|nr:hypothetical protein F4781DRAFT_167808 [Annulohypoxylon bovei var. microspora]